MAIVPDDEIPTDPEVFTSDTTSSDDDDFQPFALPDFGDDIPLVDGFPDGDLVLVPIPVPFPLAAFPLEDLPLDAMSDDDVDFFNEGPPEGAQDDGLPVDDDVVVPLFEIPVDDDVAIPLVEIPDIDVIAVPLIEVPVLEILSDHYGPNSFESVSSTTLHALGLQRYPTDSDSDTAMSAAPVPPQDFEFDGEFDPVFPRDFDPDHEIEFVPDEQPFEAPVIPDDQLFDIPADLEYAPADPEPEIAPKPIPAHDPLPEHDPAPVDIPVVAPPFPDTIPVLVDRAPSAAQVDPIYASAHNGWIKDDDDLPPFVRPVTPPPAPIHAPIDIAPFHQHVSDFHRTDLPITFLQDIPHPRPGEGPSSQQPSHIPPVSATFPFMPPFAPATHTAPFACAPTGEPLIWFPPNTMPVSDPNHPSQYVGYTRDDLLLPLQLQQELLCRRVMELERILRPPPCTCQSPFATPLAPLMPYSCS
ncbi:SH3 domain-containing protein C23A1.17-like [Helianthus annuus]|uniref:SH3 domain-containing protein C23A1.17-like n=1 Tax=Helianthus annuus TaxID=4232 RepID=UPI000B909B60|nr:SH3 domain-containing protein C23A1.17-like [Helianthus annuus]